MVSKETAKFCAELLNKQPKGKSLDLREQLQHVREQRRKQELQKEITPIMAKMFAEKIQEYQKQVQNILKRNEDFNTGLSCLAFMLLFLLFLIALLLLIVVIKIW